MKELDVLLERFLAANERVLREGAWPEFEALLECEDDLLWDQLRGAVIPEGTEFTALIRAIQDVRAPGP